MNSEARLSSDLGAGNVLGHTDPTRIRTRDAVPVARNPKIESDVDFLLEQLELAGAKRLDSQLIGQRVELLECGQDANGPRQLLGLAAKSRVAVATAQPGIGAGVQTPGCLRLVNGRNLVKR